MMLTLMLVADNTSNPLYLFGLTVSCCALVVFFASGLYTSKLSNPSKFSTRCNRALKPFNMAFNKDSKGEISFFRKIPDGFQQGYRTFRERVIG
ncbi:hypothetical protein HK101_004093 [Irineochytrium annulatum]|nr:hypothetical protein HK101_004093 [Irineochytrium annulatum]